MDKSIEFLLEMFPVEREIASEVFEANNKDLDKTLSVLISMFSTDKNHPPSYEEAVNTGENALLGNGEVEEYSNKKRRDSRRNLGKKEWKPPLLGKLPDDFLKVPNEISNNSAAKGHLCKSCAKISVVTSYQPSCDDVPTISSIGAQSFNYGTKTPNFDNMDNLLRQRMEQNANETKKLTMRTNKNRLEPTSWSEFESRSTRYSMRVLEDERLALMLQNQEFLSYVKHDKEFLRALQQDQEDNSSSIIEEDDCDTVSDIWREPNSLDDFETASVSTFNPHAEDYSYERSEISDPDHLWPDHIAHSSADENEVTKLYKAMGKASKKRLNALAKRFPSMRRKKATKNYTDITNNGSSLNLPTPLTQSGSRMPRSSPIGRPGLPTSAANWDTESTRELIYTEFDDLESIVSTSQPSRIESSTPSRRSSYNSPQYNNSSLLSRPRPKPRTNSRDLIDCNDEYPSSSSRIPDGAASTGATPTAESSLF